MTTNRSLLAAFTILAASSLAASSAIAQMSQGDQTWFVYEHPFSAPENLTGRVDAANLIVRGRIGSSSSEVLPSRDPKFPPIVTMYSFVVLEVIKGPAELSVNSRIRVFRQGGTATKDGQTLRAVNRSFPELEQGDYVLFLSPWPEKQGYRVLWGTDGVFDVGDTMVKARGASKLSKENDLKAREQFLLELRQAARLTPK